MSIVSHLLLLGMAGIVLGLLAPAGLLADTFKQLKVIVNQLDGASVPNTEDRQKEMNDILKQCDAFGIRVRVTISGVRTNQNPMDPASPTNAIAPGGNVAGDREVSKLTQVAKNGEVKKGGFKVWVGKSMYGGTNINGSTYTGEPATVVREQSGYSGDARTWTHELGHGLGLDHTPGDSNNLLYPFRMTGDGKTPAGSSLTKDQCEKLAKALDLLNPTTDKTKEQLAEPKAKTTRHVSQKIPTTGGPPPGSRTDLNSLSVSVDHQLIDPASPSVYLTVQLNTILPPNPLVTYRVWLDTDHNPTTGNPEGYDFVVEHRLIAPTQGQATLIALDMPIMPQVLEPYPVETVFLAVSGQTEGYEIPAGTVFTSRVPLSLLPIMSPIIRISLTADEDAMNPDQIPAEPVEMVPLPEPMLDVVPMEVLPGQPVMVSGFQFTPMSEYRLLCDDVRVADGLTGPAGELNTVFIAPQLPADDYLVDVIDAQGQIQIAVLRILDTQGLHIRVSGPEVILSFKTILGPTYIVEYKDSLDEPIWHFLHRIEGTGNTVEVHDPAPPGQMRYYRWREETRP